MFFPQVPVITKGQKPDQEVFEKLKEKLDHLDHLLEGKFFLVGNRVTLADISLIPMVSILQPAGINLEKYHNLNNWMTRCKQQIPKYDEYMKPYEAHVQTVCKGKFWNL